MMLRGWELKEAWLIPFVDGRVSDRYTYVKPR